MRRVLQKLRLPPVYQYVKRVLPNDWWRYCRGVYPTFAAAQAAIPNGRRIGYDHADIPLPRAPVNIRPSDYAVLFWLATLARAKTNVFDLGGSIGTAFYVFQKYTPNPTDLRWLVYDVPAVVQAGRVWAHTQSLTTLQFTTEFEEANGFEILHTAGALQYVAEELPDLLAPLREMPRHLLINRVPLTDKSTYFTVQDIGASHCPYRISNRQQFLGSLAKLGYAVVDEWQCPESWCSVLLHRSLTVRAYSGFYLRRAQ